MKDVGLLVQRTIYVPKKVYKICYRSVDIKAFESAITIYESVGFISVISCLRFINLTKLFLFLSKNKLECFLPAKNKQVSLMFLRYAVCFVL